MAGQRDAYEAIDANIRALVYQVNGFPGIRTVASCGGHPDPGPGQNPQGVWDVLFVVDHTEEGWRSLEFLAWVAHDIRRGLGDIWLLADSAPPYLNTPGQTLKFGLSGRVDPSRVAHLMGEWRGESYVPARPE